MNPRKPKADVGFLDAAYFAGIRGPGGRWLVRPGQWHTGNDFNGPYGGDSDLGQPVHAIADGVVEFAGPGSGWWGNLVVIRHDGPGVWTRSAHLNDVKVSLGQSVSAGQEIGTVGKGAKTAFAPKGIFAAHLHFDVIIKRPASWSDWPGADRARVLEYYVDPTKFFGKQTMLNPPVWIGGDA